MHCRTKVAPRRSPVGPAQSSRNRKTHYFWVLNRSNDRRRGKAVATLLSHDWENDQGSLRYVMVMPIGWRFPFGKYAKLLRKMRPNAKKCKSCLMEHEIHYNIAMYYGEECECTTTHSKQHTKPLNLPWRPTVAVSHMCAMLLRAETRPPVFSDRYQSLFHLLRILGAEC